MMDEKNLMQEENTENKPAGVVCENGVCRIDFSQFEDAKEEKAEEVVEEKATENEDEMSMQDLMDKYDKPVRMGQIIKGKVIQLDDKEAIIGLVGAGNDGKLSIDEVSFETSEKLTEMLKIGDEVEAKIIRRPMESDSFYILSMKEMQREESKEELMSKLNTEERVKAKVKEAVKGGVVATYKGHRIFVPSSQIEIRPARNLEDYVGKELELNIIEAEEKRGALRIVGSRKSYLEKEANERAQKTWDALEVDQIVKGKIERITDFGAFINVDGVDGLLHISEIAYGKTPKPSSVLNIGEEINLKVINVDKENKKLSLSLKALKEIHGLIFLKSIL